MKHPPLGSTLSISILVTLLIVCHLHGYAGRMSGGWQLMVNGTATRVTSFSGNCHASFDLQGTSKLDLSCPMVVQSCEISPGNLSIPVRTEGNRIQLTLRKPCYLVLRINEKEKFFLFAEKPEIVPSDTVSILQWGVVPGLAAPQTDLIRKALGESARQRKTLLFPAGNYTSSQLCPPSNCHIHLARGAVLHCDTANVGQYGSGDSIKTRRFISIRDVSGVKISGYGTICGHGRRMRALFGDDARMRLILIVNSQNVRLEGITLLDPGSWNTQILLCRDVVIRHVKLLNDTGLSNTDGFDPDGSQKVLIENCFASCSDDNVAVKSTGAGGLLSNVEDITIRSCLFLTRKSALKVGTETRAAVMRHIRFINNDIVESDRGMALYVTDGTILEKVLFSGNRFSQNFPDAKRAGIWFQVSRRNPGSPAGRIHSVVIRGCNFRKPFPNPSRIEGLDVDHQISGITFRNLVIAGKKATSAGEANLLANPFTSNIRFR